MFRPRGEKPLIRPFIVALRSSCWLLALSPALAVAAPAPPYLDLLRQSDAAPSLAESRANVRAAQGQADQAGVLPNPVVGYEAENLAARSIDGLSQRQDTLSISQALELGGKRPARI